MMVSWIVHLEGTLCLELEMGLVAGRLRYTGGSARKRWAMIACLVFSVLGAGFICLL